MSLPPSYEEKRNLLMELINLPVPTIFRRDMRITFEEEVLEITISPVNNGWVVRAGCYTLVFTDPQHLAAEFSRYLHNPKEIMKEYRDKFSLSLDGEAGAMGIAGDMAKEEIQRNRYAGEDAMLRTTAKGSYSSAKR